MQDHERQVVIDHLVTSQDRILRAVDGLTPAQWAFRPAGDRWSIADCLEHVIRVENRIYALIGEALTKEMPQPEKHLPADELRDKDARVAKGVIDRSVARQAPDAVRPTGEWQGSESLIAGFLEARGRSREFAAATQGDLRSYFRPHGAFGEIDCYQWLLVLSLHGARHAEQMEEIRRAPGFPQG